MDSFSQLEYHINELATAVKSLASYSRGADNQAKSTHQPLIDPEAHDEAHRAQESILSNVAKIKTLVYGPTDFLKHLASQSEIISCLRWFGEFQILACIPLVGSVPIKDVAELSGVPETHLGRVIRLTATAAFLYLPQPGYVAHTALSAPFVTNPSLLDAAMFLAESAAPAALQMAPATQRFGLGLGDSHHRRPNESAYNLALNTMQSFHTACQERPKLDRQWSAYLHYAAGLPAAYADTAADVLTQLNWSNINTSNVSTCIVEVGAASAATSTARCLAARYPALNFVVQISDPATSTTGPISFELTSQITVTNRSLGSRQTITDAAVYILHLPSASSMASAILTELQVYLGILQTSSGVMLILTPRLLPEFGSIPNPEIESTARARDLTLLQLANESEMEMSELLELIDTVRDSVGKLVVTNKLRSHDNLIMALVIKYQVYPKRILDLQRNTGLTS